jgi:hypothetical protein
VHKVVKTGLKPAILYGARCLGLPKQQVSNFRKIPSACLRCAHRGCSTTLRLGLHRAEVTHELQVPPILEWASAIWDNRIDASIMLAAWKRQLPGVCLASSIPIIKGAAAAVADAVQRVGWTWPHWAYFFTRSGLHIDLKSICPRDVEAMFKYDSDLALREGWCRDSQYDSIKPRPLIEPVSAFACSRAGYDGGRDMAISVVTRGALTQSVLHDMDKADDPWCKLCGEQGTPHHRFWTCPGL